MSASLEKQIVARIRKNKCTQSNCKSEQSENMEIVVFGDQKYKRKGLMCSTCFIDQELLAQLGNPEAHAISIQKFMKVLTKQYNLYANKKLEEDWAPNKFEQQREVIKKKIMNLQRQTNKGVMEIMKYLEDAKKQAEEEAKKINYDDNFQKLYDLINEEVDDEQERINVTKQIKEIVLNIEVDQGQFKMNTEDALKKKNETIIQEYRKKTVKAKEAILKLIEVHKRCIKYLIE